MNLFRLGYIQRKALKVRCGRVSVEAVIRNKAKQLRLLTKARQEGKKLNNMRGVIRGDGAIIETTQGVVQTANKYGEEYFIQDKSPEPDPIMDHFHSAND